MRYIFLILICIALTACQEDSSGTSSDSGANGTGTATLSWLPPTETTDGSTLSNLAGYKVYYGTGSGDYLNEITIENPGIASYMIENLTNGYTYYFAVTAFDENGNESGFSAEASKTI